MGESESGKRPPHPRRLALPTELRVDRHHGSSAAACRGQRLPRAGHSGGSGRRGCRPLPAALAPSARVLRTQQTANLRGGQHGEGPRTSQQCTCKAHTPTSDPSAEKAASPVVTRPGTGPERRRRPRAGDSNLEGPRTSLPDCSLSWLLVCIFMTASLTI